MPRKSTRNDQYNKDEYAVLLRKAKGEGERLIRQSCRNHLRNSCCSPPRRFLRRRLYWLPIEFKARCTGSQPQRTGSSRTADCSGVCKG